MDLIFSKKDLRLLAGKNFMILRTIEHWNKLEMVDSRNRKYDLVWWRILCPNWWCSLIALEKLSICFPYPPLRNSHSHCGCDVRASHWPRQLPFSVTHSSPILKSRARLQFNGCILAKRSGSSLLFAGYSHSVSQIQHTANLQLLIPDAQWLFNDR